jgi:hypothetical protein
MRGINISKAHSEKSSRWHMEFCSYFRAYSEKSHPGISDSALLSVPFISSGCSECGFPKQIKGTHIKKNIYSEKFNPRNSAVISGPFISIGCPGL